LAGTNQYEEANKTYGKGCCSNFQRGRGTSKRKRDDEMLTFTENRNVKFFVNDDNINEHMIELDKGLFLCYRIVSELKQNGKYIKKIEGMLIYTTFKEHNDGYIALS